MYTFLYIAAAVLVILQLTLPAKWAFVPLLLAACHFGNAEVLPQLTLCRMVILVGLVRAALMGSFSFSFKCGMDKVILAFCVIAVLVSVAPRLDVASPLRQNLGLILNIAGSYFYGRSLLKGEAVLERFAIAFGLVLLPLSGLMLIEQRTGENMYARVGASRESMTRLDRVRACGPFRHPILAGTLGATSFPLMLVLWRRRKAFCAVGLGACTIITFASASSGPLAALIAVIGALCIWPFRRRIVLIQTVFGFAVLAAHLASSRGIWYLMASIDLVGGSTGYHRARLIDSALSDFSRWWFVGTDYTRKWMFSGVSWSDRHTDITNYYLHLGVIGGVGLMICLILLYVLSVFYIETVFITRPVSRAIDPDFEWNGFSTWCVAAALCGHGISCFSISYFDQMYAVFYVTVGLIPGVTIYRHLSSERVRSVESVVAEVS